MSAWRPRMTPDRDLAASRCRRACRARRVGGARASADRALHLPPLDRVLPPRAEAIYAAIAPRVDTRVGDGRRRLHGAAAGGSPAILRYDRSIDFIARARLRATQASRHRVDDVSRTPDRAGNTQRGTLAIDGAPREIVLSREQDRVALCINSFSTPRRRRRAAAGRCRRRSAPPTSRARTSRARSCSATRRDRAALDAGRARARRRRRRSRRDIARYTRPRVTPDVLQWGSIPYDEARRRSAFKATPRAARRLREALAAGPVTCARRYRDDAFIAGRTARCRGDPGQRRAPTSASCWSRTCRSPARTTTPAGRARCWRRRWRCTQAIAQRRDSARRARTLTFMWLDEIRGSEQWIKDHSGAGRDGRRDDVARHDRRGHGEDRRHVPDREDARIPSAIWPRPSDPHSEWGAGEVDRALGARPFPQRPSSRRRACAARATPDGSCGPIPTKAAAITRCSRAPACPRSSTGTSPIATTTPISTPPTRPAPRRWATWRRRWRRRRCSSRAPTLDAAPR